MSKKVERLWNGFLSYVRGFGCVENEVLSTYGKSALMHKKWIDRVEMTKKTSHCKSRDFLRKRRLKTCNVDASYQHCYKTAKQGNIYLAATNSGTVHFLLMVLNQV